jgi:hypothetical protein
MNAPTYMHRSDRIVCSASILIMPSVIRSIDEFLLYRGKLVFKSLACLPLHDVMVQVCPYMLAVRSCKRWSSDPIQCRPL